MLSLSCRTEHNVNIYAKMFGGRNSSFALSGLGAAFADRQKDLFASLDAAEKEREEKSKDQPPVQPILKESSDIMDVVIPTSRKRKSNTKQFQGKESIFKRPEMPPPRSARHSVPDHQRNPHKWTRYSLGDVSPQDMSERTNTVAALSFLRELQARKAHMDEEDDNALEQPVVFKSSRQRNERALTSSGTVAVTAPSSEEADRPSFRSSKLVMPEYVVGQKKEKKKNPDKKTEKSESSSKAIKLGHLMDEEDE